MSEEQTRTRVRVDLVISHLPVEVDAGAKDVILRAIARAAGGLLGEIEPGAKVEIEDADALPARVAP